MTRQQPFEKAAIRKLHGPDAVALYDELVRRGTHVLPCGPFHWDRPQDGVRQVRLALARSGEDVVRAARALVDAVRARL